MAIESRVHDLCIRAIGRSIIKATTAAHPYVLPISNFDHLSGRYPVTLFYAYRNPPSDDFSSVVAAIKTSLSEILSFFQPFAGRIVNNPDSNEVEILCNNQGAELIEALADVSLASLDLYDLDSSVRKLMLPFDHEVPLNLQVTGYTCGGFSLAWTFDHLLADGTAFVKFLTLWSEMGRTKKISTIPNHDRTMFCQRSPPSVTCSPLLDRIFTTCTLDEILACPRTGIIQRLYYVEGSCLDRLRAISSEGGCRRTRTEALTAYVWKILGRSLADTDTTSCKMAWVVDGRTRLDGVDTEAISNYVGNLVSMAVGEASVRELEEESLSHVAGIASRAIREVTNEAHFMELADWIEGRRPAMVLAKVLLGIGGPAVAVSSCHNMPVMSTDFGFGPPAVGTFFTMIEGLGAGAVNLISSGKGDGSWFISAIVWPRLAMELESDPDRVFKRITPAYLGL